MKSVLIIGLLASVCPSFAHINDKSDLAFHCSKLAEKPALTIADGFSATANMNVSEAAHYLSRLESLFRDTISAVCDQPQSKHLKITIEEPISLWFVKSAGSLELLYLGNNENSSKGIVVDMEYHLKSKGGDIFILQQYDEKVYLAIKTF